MPPHGAHGWKQNCPGGQVPAPHWTPPAWTTPVPTPVAVAVAVAVVGAVEVVVVVATAVGDVGGAVDVPVTDGVTVAEVADASPPGGRSAGDRASSEHAEPPATSAATLADANARAAYCAARDRPGAAATRGARASSASQKGH